MPRRIRDNRRGNPKGACAGHDRVAARAPAAHSAQGVGNSQLHHDLHLVDDGQPEGRGYRTHEEGLGVGHREVAGISALNVAGLGNGNRRNGVIAAPRETHSQKLDQVLDNRPGPNLVIHDLAEEARLVHADLLDRPG